MVVRRTMPEVDLLWAEHVGSSKLHSREELEILRRIADSRLLPRDDIYQLYLISKHWRMMRRKVLARDGGACVRCKSVYVLHVDHIRYRGMGKELMDDLQTLCMVCHAEKTKMVDLAAYSSKVVCGVDDIASMQMFCLLRVKRVVEGNDGQGRV